MCIQKQLIVFLMFNHILFVFLQICFDIKFTVGFSVG